MDQRIRAWIAENSADHDFYFASGRFGAHIEIDRGDVFELGDELEDAPLEEALQWARARSPVVLVRLWGTDYFSAGEVNPDPETFPALPREALTVGPRRPRGLEALDNTENDPPTPWDVRLHAGAGTDEAAFRAAVYQDERALPVPPEAVDEHLEGIRVLVQASTQAQAWAIAQEIFDHAGKAAGNPTMPRTGREPLRARWYEVYPFAPDAPISFGGGRMEVLPAIVEAEQESD